MSQPENKTTLKAKAKDEQTSKWGNKKGDWKSFKGMKKDAQCACRKSFDSNYISSMLD